MAKVMKAKRNHFYLLNQLLAKIPKQAFEDGSMKIHSFGKAVKKVNQKQLDEISDLQKAKNKKLENEIKQVQELSSQLKDLEKITAKTTVETLKMAELREQMKKIDDEAAKKVEVETKGLEALQDELNNSKEVEVKFDNEVFNFMEEVFKKNPTLFQTQDEKQFDVDSMSIVFDMFENAYSPKED